MDEFNTALFINLNCQLQALICRREGMVAANTACAGMYNTRPRYSELDFAELANEMLAVLPDPRVYG